MESITCNRCKVEKSESEFYRRPSGKMQKTCQSCMRDVRNAYKLRNPDANKYAIVKKRYNLSREQYDLMTKDGCNVCGSTDLLGIDHDHSCCEGNDKGYTCGNCIRGVLCRRCNALEAWLKSDAQLAYNFYKYLSGNRKSGSVNDN